MEIIRKYVDCDSGIIYDTIVELRIVLDTNVFLSALRSRRVASFHLVSLIEKGMFRLNVSVPLILEYESDAKRMSSALGISHTEIDNIIDYICSVAEHREIFYLWRPFLRDPNDDMVLEVAVESESDFIVTHNVKDFSGTEQFRLRAITPWKFLQEIGGLP